MNKCSIARKCRKTVENGPSRGFIVFGGAVFRSIWGIRPEFRGKSVNALLDKRTIGCYDLIKKGG